MAADAVLKDLLLVTKDGEWGKAEPDSDLVEMATIRGTDFDSVRVGDSNGVPTRYIPKRIADRKRLQPRDILIETAGGSKDKPTGRTVLLKNSIFEAEARPITCASFSRFLRVDESLAHPEFVYWYLQYLYTSGQMDAHQVQHTGIARFQYTRFAETTTIPLPPTSEQRAIAHILGTLDDKIELNRRTNETLEEMVRAIFKSWFVDFDPVRAKAEGRDPSLPKHIADLFPDRLEVSDLGEIPVGWPLTLLSEVLTAKNDRVGESSVPEYSSTNEGLQLRSERFKKQLSASTSKNKLVRRGDLVFGLSRRVLNFGLMRDDIGCVSPAYKVFAINKSMVVPDLLERIMRLRSTYFYGSISASSREGQSVSTEGLGLLNFVRPDPKAQEIFYLFTEPIRAWVKNLQSETRTLTAVRDALLPWLVSGELRAPEVNRFIDEVMP